MLAIQKMSDDGLSKRIKDLKADIEHLEFVYTAKKLSGMCETEDIEQYARYRSYCILLLDAVKKERKNRKSKTKKELK